jgi:hypothetical protein
LAHGRNAITVDGSLKRVLKDIPTTKFSLQRKEGGSLTKRMMSDPASQPGWPYVNPKAQAHGMNYGRRWYQKEEKMKLSIRVNHGALIEAVTLTQEHADILDVMRYLKDFLSGRDIKTVSITIEEKTRHE